MAGEVDRRAASGPSESAAQQPEHGHSRDFVSASSGEPAPCRGPLPSSHLPLGPTEPLTLGLRLGGLASLPAGTSAPRGRDPSAVNRELHGLE